MRTSRRHSRELDWVHWFNNQRLLEPIGHIPPAELEDTYQAAQTAAVVA